MGSLERRKSEFIAAAAPAKADSPIHQRSLAVKGARERRRSCPAIRDRDVCRGSPVARAPDAAVPQLVVSVGRGLSAQAQNSDVSSSADAGTFEGIPTLGSSASFGSNPDRHTQSPTLDSFAHLPEVNDSNHCLFFNNVRKIAERLRQSNKEKETAHTVEVPKDAGERLRALKGQTSHEENIAAGRRLLAIRTSGLKVEQHTMIGDGNCLFRSISYQLYGTQDRHQEVRQLCVEQLATERAQYSLYYDTEEEFDRYVEGMKKACTWGDEIALKAMCDKLKFVAYVLTSTMGAWYLRYVPQDMEAPEYSTIRHIFLAYLYPIHWDALRYTDGSEIVLSPEEVLALPDLVSDTRTVIVSPS